MCARRLVLACASALILSVSPAAALTLTAICGAPQGMTIGYEDPRKVQFEADGFKGTTVTVSWNIGDPTASIVTQSSAAAGGTPTTERGIPVAINDEHFAFLVVYQRAIIVYSIYPAMGVLMLAKHADGRGPVNGSASAHLMHARCRVSTN